MFFPSQTLCPSVCCLSLASSLSLCAFVSVRVYACASIFVSSCLCLYLWFSCLFPPVHLCVLSYLSRFPTLFHSVPSFFVRALVSSLCRLRPFMKSSSAWTAMSAFASHDSKVVYRSGSILGYPENFRYKEVVSFKVRGQRGEGQMVEGGVL